MPSAINEDNIGKDEIGTEIKVYAVIIVIVIIIIICVIYYSYKKSSFIGNPYEYGFDSHYYNKWY